MTFGDPDDVYHLGLVEDRGHRDGLLQLLLDPVHLLGDGAAVQLHLHDMGLLSFEGQQANLERHNYKCTEASKIHTQL